MSLIYIQGLLEQLQPRFPHSEIASGDHTDISMGLRLWCGRLIKFSFYLTYDPGAVMMSSTYWLYHGGSCEARSGDAWFYWADPQLLERVTAQIQLTCEEAALHDSAHAAHDQPG